MNEVLEKISKIGIVPVVVLDDAKDAEPLAEALIKGVVFLVQKLHSEQLQQKNLSELWHRNSLKC